MKNTRKVLTSLKPRVSFGITGRSDFDAYKSLSTYNTNGSYLFDGRWVTGYAPSSNANPDLAWEKSVAINLGVDFVLSVHQCRFLVRHECNAHFRSLGSSILQTGRFPYGFQYQ